jgi:tetratricopeptide (TPR) repeat protein
MHLVRFPCIRLLAPVMVLLAAACSKGTHEKTAVATKPHLSFNDTLTLQNASESVSTRLCSVLSHSSDTAPLGLFNRTLDSTAEMIAKNMTNEKDGRSALKKILQIVYETWNVGFDSRDTLLETLLPHLVYRNRKGACLGVSLIILMLAEKIGCPIYGVMLPGHFFCRYDDGKCRINIEPNRQGYAHPDDYYLQRYPCEHRPGYNLDNLDKKAVIGVLCYNAGALCMNHKQYDAAIDYYREAVRRIPDFAEAKGNYAVVLAKKGALDTAMVLFDELFMAHPDMVNLAVNYGYVATAAKQYSRAVSVYQKGLEYFPNDTLLRRRLEKISCGFKFLGKKQKNE